VGHGVDRGIDQRGEQAPDLVDAPDLAWVGDVTYVKTWQGWAFMATVIDCFSRRVVGWAIAEHMRTDLIIDALRMAIITRNPPPGVIFHSDRGSQGEFNRSSQHLDYGGVDGSAGGVDEGVDGQIADEVAGCAGTAAGSRAFVLAPDRQGAEQ
jgi:hypothetical protein